MQAEAGMQGQQLTEHCWAGGERAADILQQARHVQKHRLQISILGPSQACHTSTVASQSSAEGNRYTLIWLHMTRRACSCLQRSQTLHFNAA